MYVTVHVRLMVFYNDVIPLYHSYFFRTICRINNQASQYRFKEFKDLISMGESNSIVSAYTMYILKIIVNIYDKY